jgi:ABC-2 type transport system ATP-binding protein
VFLTTQYLEEADVLADRVGIIDRGKIVAEGTPAQLKAQVAKPTVEVVPRDAGECAIAATALEPFGEHVAPRVAGSIAVRLNSGADQLADIVRALDHANVAVANLALHEPTLDDVFLAKTGRSLEGAADGGPGAGRGSSAGPDRADGAGPADPADPADPPAGGRQRAAA